MNRPLENEFAPYFKKYIDLVPQGIVMNILEESTQSFLGFIEKFPEEKGDYRYAEGKWSVKQVLSHIIDTERIMAYRALRIARGDTMNLIGYDQDQFVANTNFEQISLNMLKEEFHMVRKSTSFLFNSFDKSSLTKMGKASNKAISTRALCYLIIGHQLHHQKVLQERY